MRTRAPLSPRRPPLHFDRYGLRPAVPAAIALADGQGQLLQVSAAFAELLQVDRLTLQGCRVEKVLPPEDWRELQRALSGLREGVAPDAMLSVRFVTREQRMRRCLTALYALRRRDGSLESVLLALSPVGPPVGGALVKPVLMSTV